MQVDLKVLQLLCSRLCHDLVGPSGAARNGMELYREIGDDDALEMVAASNRRLSARLAFFRMAFGAGGLNDPLTALSEARKLAGDFLEGGRVGLDWPSGGESRPSGPVVKLLLNMILVAIDALPRGGTLGVSIGPAREGPAVVVEVVARGDGAGLKDDLLAALSADGAAGLNAHNVHGFYCRSLARSVSSGLEISGAENQVRLTVVAGASK